MKFVEEILELDKELIKKNFSDGTANRKQIIEEIADVGIMFDQMFLILDMDVPLNEDVRYTECVFRDRYKEFKDENVHLLRYIDPNNQCIDELVFIEVSLKLVILDKEGLNEEIGFARYCYQVIEDKYNTAEEVFTARMEKLSRLEKRLEGANSGK
jgi:hypothetical protein